MCINYFAWTLQDACACTYLKSPNFNTYTYMHRHFSYMHGEILWLYGTWPNQRPFK